MGKLKKWVKNQKSIFWFFNHLPFNNKIKVRGNNKFKADCAMLKKCVVKVTGENNLILLGKNCRLYDCSFIINGSNNIIELSDSVSAYNAEFYIEDSQNHIFCGDHTCFAGKIHLACTEGKNITIGDHCLFSSDIVIRTGDSHSVTDLEGNRINFAKDVEIGNHVWAGYRALINKGVKISADSVIGTGAVVTRAFEAPNVCIAGNPAKVVKENISWADKR